MHETLDRTVEIRTFNTISEIEALPGFKKENPVSPKNYKHLLGDYFLSDEVKCCLLKDNDKLCNEGHKWGFVAVLADNSITLVGNDCAQTKFNGESRLSADRTKYLNQKKHEEGLERLRALVEQKDSALKEVLQVRTDLAMVQRRVHAMREKLGPQTMRHLESIARTGAYVLSVTGVTIKEYTDKKGKKKTDRRTQRMTLGTIANTSFLLDEKYRDVLHNLSDVKKAYDEAEKIEQNVTTLNSMLSQKRWISLSWPKQALFNLLNKSESLRAVI
ncbi:hypothetical protein [Pseudomonas koreensis]|uniref:Uncharacterized protein n=1 Tax=Pseudomonas koreensis TaxID=198620 RepID=A0A9X2XMG8_9PSED|nr:hypothetical protein [Pseudomonas koreensis]MCU7251228.1 hypothetical protein [Pseudomonas koreensis]